MLSNTKRQFQLKNDRLFNASQETGLKINIAKTKVMRFNAVNNEKVVVNGDEFEDVDSFAYLRAKVTTSGGADNDIIGRLEKARAAFCKLTNIWKSSQPSKSTKIRISRSNVIAVDVRM